jgi:uncharacterized membrane protein YtjA (UPF0391 family)
MNSGIDSFHKILKDENRRRIILLIHEKKSICYVELMKALGITSTGKMNYHLKILGNLLSKNEAGQYTLTEKGDLASRLLLEFPEQNRQQLGLKPKWWRRFWIESSIVAVIVLIAILVACLLGYTGLEGAQQGITGIVSAIAVSYMITHILKEVLSKRAQLTVAKSVYVVGGALLGYGITFFGVGLLLSGFSKLLDKPLLGLFWNEGYMIFSFVVAPTIGAFIGYLIGKRRRFRTPNYVPDP